MSSGIDPKVDVVFKRLFGSAENRPLCISLLRGVLENSPAIREPIVDIELINPYNDKETMDDKLSILDIKARDQTGRWFNIEMQMRLTAFYEDRALYYWARLHKDQLKEGEDYGRLRPTIGIHFVNESIRPDKSEFHFRFRLGDERHPDIRFSDQLEVHVIQLPQFRLKLDQLRTPRDQWCYFLRYGEALSTTEVPPQLNSPEIERAVEVLKHMDADIHERERYESRLKAQRDALMFERDAIARGLQQGMEKGLEKGMEKGLEKGMEKGLEKGMEKGLEQGRNQGLSQGLNQGLWEGLVLALEIKFGEAGRSLAPSIQSIEDFAKLRELKQKLLSSSTVEEFRVHLGGKA